LNSDEFFRVSQCGSAKEMWDILEVTHEGITDVKRARKHALIQEYEMFKMLKGETISNRSWQSKGGVEHEDPQMLG